MRIIESTLSDREKITCELGLNLLFFHSRGCQLLNIITVLQLQAIAGEFPSMTHEERILGGRAELSSRELAFENGIKI